MVKSNHLSQFINGIANFGINYNFQSIAIALLVMSEEECTLDQLSCRHGEQLPWVHSFSSAVIFIGAILGQLSMGYIGDLIGNNQALIITLVIVTLSALLSAIIPTNNATTVYSAIITLRFFLGIGLGGIFPLTATKSSEDNGDSSGLINPVRTAWTFFWQMPGTMAPWLVGYILSCDGNVSISYQWRLILGVGAIPPLLSIIGLIIENFIHIPDISFIGYHNKDDHILLSNSVHDRRSLSTSQSEQPTLTYWTLAKYLISTGGVWMLFDFIGFGVSLSGGEIIDAISNSNDDNLSSPNRIQFVSSRQLIAASMGIPGALLGIQLLPHIGLKNLQVISFLFIALCAILLAVLFNTAHYNNTNGLFVLYCLLNFSLQSGVNITTFSLPSVLFPKKQRASYNGLAAAMGKVGAFIGSYSFYAIANISSYAVVMGFSCVVALFGAILSDIFIDIKVINQNVTYQSDSSKVNSTPEINNLSDNNL